MPKVIKASGIQISRSDKGELLLRVNLRGLNTGEEEAYSWMPQWETVRNLIFSAIAVEAFNNHDSDELELFARSLNTCGIVRNRLFHLFDNSLGREE